MKRKDFKSCRFPLIRKSAEVLILEGLREGEGVLLGERWHGQLSRSYLLRAREESKYSPSGKHGQYGLLVFERCGEADSGMGRRAKRKTPLMPRKPNRGAKTAFRKSIRNATNALRRNGVPRPCRVTKSAPSAQVVKVNTSSQKFIQHHLAWA